MLAKAKMDLNEDSLVKFELEKGLYDSLLCRLYYRHLFDYGSYSYKLGLGSSVNRFASSNIVTSMYTSFAFNW